MLLNLFWLQCAINMQDLVNKLQYIVDNYFPEGFCFPDGDYWPKSGTPEFEQVWGK